MGKRERHVEVYRGKDGWYRFRLVGGNGEKQAASQPYKAHRNGTPSATDSRRSAKRGAASAHPGVPVKVLT